MNIRSSYISGPNFLENFTNFCMYDVQKHNHFILL